MRKILLYCLHSLLALFSPPELLERVEAVESKAARRHIVTQDNKRRRKGENRAQ
jgi:hypothetical protein